MADESTGPYPGEIEDLFNFPAVDGFEEFGLVPPVAGGAAPAAAEPGEDSAAPAVDAAAAEAPTAAAEAAPAAPIEVAAARPNPPTPEGITDLDEDIFNFDEVFTLEDDPFLNGTLDEQGRPTTPLPDNDPLADPEIEAVLAADRAAQEAVAPEADPFMDEPAAPAPAAAAPAPAPAPAPAAQPTPAAAPAPEIRPAAAAAPQPAPAAAPAPDAFDDTPLGAPLVAPSVGGAGRDRGPRILLPEDVPYSLAGGNGRILTALIICFLLINTGIFYLAQQASTNVNDSMARATGLLADALTKNGGVSEPIVIQAPVMAAQPAALGPAVTHEVETPSLKAELDALPPAKPKEKFIDPRNYKDPVALAVAHSKLAMEESRFEEARALLNYVLANQGQSPVSTETRAEIDFLIPLTYYLQGRATASGEDSE